MKKVIAVLVVIFLTLLIGARARASSLPTSIIPAEAEWVIHFDLEKFTSTRMGEYILYKQDLLGLEKKNAHFYKKYNINILKDIDCVTIFGTEKEEENTVVCLRGNFNQEFLLGLLAAESSHSEIPHGKYTIHNWDHDEYGVFVNKNMALITQDESMLKTTLDVIDGKKENITSSPLMTYINQIPVDAYLAAMADNISSMIKNEAKVFVLRKTQSAMFSLKEDEQNVHMKLNFVVETIEDANKMEDVLKGLVALANMQLAEKNTELRLPEDILISTEGNKVQVEISYPSEALLDIILGKKEFSPFSLLAQIHHLP